MRTHHKKRVISSSANNADLDPVLGVPLLAKRVSFYGSWEKSKGDTYPGITIEYVDIFPSVQVIDSTFTVDLESVC